LSLRSLYLLARPRTPETVRNGGQCLKAAGVPGEGYSATILRLAKHEVVTA
jgi:hypothetical protein